MPVMQGLAYYNQKLLTMAEHWEDFIMDRQLKSPNVWHDRVPKGNYQLFSGLEQKSNVYRGGLPVQAGLSTWSTIGMSRKPASGDVGYDACAPKTPQTYSYAWETLTYSGYEDSWQSEPVCLEDLKWVDYARDQLALIVRTGVDFGISMLENFNREMYVYQAARAGRTVVLADGALSFEDDADYRFSYDPFLNTTDIDGATVPYIKFPSTLEVSSLNWGVLDYIRQSLGDRAGEAALSRDSGMPIFGLMLDLMDFEKMIMSDANLREDFRFAKPQNVITGYDFGMRVYRGFALIHDPRQMRFRFFKIGAGSNSTDDASGYVIATRVLPLRAGRAVTIGNIPEPNPDFYRAELGVGVVFMNDVLVNLFVPTINDLGSGMKFGPAPGYNGEWKWINIPDPQTNMFSNTGFFLGRYQIFPKPLMYASECTVFLYRRCPQAWKTVCAVQDLDDVAAPGAVALAADAATADFVLASRQVTLTTVSKLDVGINDAVTILNAGGTSFAARVADSSLAPTYTFSWASGATNAPTAYTDFTAAVTTVTVA